MTRHQGFGQLTAFACPLVRDNIDTDALIPTSENTRMGSTGFSDALFANWRYLNVISRQPNPDFILNQMPFKKAQILISGKNFGSGSSRESAVWALRDYGFRAILAINFNETFMKNCISNGLAPLSLTRSVIDLLANYVIKAPEQRLCVDLISQRIIADKTYSFDIDPYYKKLLSGGISELDILLQHKESIEKLAEKRNIEMR